ncbi:MAG: hypothetical protein K0S23_1287 [Fluviicola sp.]|jgi:hypothetical protein|uniref:hypothetical protein n=1 Tax=Fluviicola sp. TaxID=1917219 RepID=UPI00260896E1|nr:hypothetical protein [Fluviicola sp.]MDF3026980.1 hypothetical protein [Fluviicola sp.]
MKSILTSALLIGFAAFSPAQNSSRTPSGNQETTGNSPLAVRSPDESSTSEAIAVLNTIRQGLKTETKTQSVFTEAEYRTLIGNADNFTLERKYDNALVLYNEVLKNKEDQYAKDRILEVQALRAKQQQQEEQQQKDDILRAKAESASSNNSVKHIVHFTGALLSDEFSSSGGTTKIFDSQDPYSNFLRPGKYDILSHYLQKSGHHTLDGIAIPANTRLIVYKNQYCRGEILLDITGPAIVNNVIWSEMDAYKQVNTKEFNEQLQPYFPQATRRWSTGNMHEWTKGSMEIRMEVSE